MGQEMGGRFKREGISVYIWLIHVEVSQKMTKFYKAINLKLKNKKKKKKKKERMWFSSVQSHRCVECFVIPWTAAHQAFLSTINSWSLLKLISIELVMPSNHLILCCSLLLPPSIFPSIRVLQMSQFFASSGQSIAFSASASVLSMNIRD